MRSFQVLAVSFAIASLAHGQQDARSRLKPITSPIRHAGVYHVATGNWTRGADLMNQVGPDGIYNNTCEPVYFTGMLSCERIQHRSRIPSTSSPTSDSVFYGTSDPAHRFDSRPGCHDAYTINGFRVGYCSSHIGTVDWEYQFASSYAFCGAADMVPQYTILVSGLPGGTSMGGQNCWTLDIDISGLPGGGIFLVADADGTFDGGGASDSFGWAFGPTGSVVATDFTGPLIAGDFSWTGGPGTVSGVLTPCTGTDGTIWDRPIDPGEPGSGMSSSDFFREVGPSPCVEQPGCYSFGGHPHSDFYLKLYSNADCPILDPLTAFCHPGLAGVRTCPCGSPPASATVGCNNFGPSPPGGTGGANLDATGEAMLVADSVQFQVTGEIASAGNLTVLWQGTTVSANSPPSGFQFGAGVRCVGGTLKRIYKGNASGGAVVFPSGVQPDVHTASAAKGYTIVPPITLHYFAAYRNSAAGGPCGNASLGYNATNAGSIAWTP